MVQRRLSFTSRSYLVQASGTLSFDQLHEVTLQQRSLVALRRLSASLQYRALPLRLYQTSASSAAALRATGQGERCGLRPPSRPIRDTLGPHSGTSAGPRPHTGLRIGPRANASRGKQRRGAFEKPSLLFRRFSRFFSDSTPPASSIPHLL